METTDALWKWDAVALAEAIRARKISARDAVAACVDRMHAVNPRLNAVTVDLSEHARALADRADEAVARGERLGPLHGVPVTIKENVDQAGCATVNGVAAYRDVIAAEDSPVVANWKKAGAIVIGRTNTPAFSFRLDTVNDFRGRTYSPWSRGHTPGGSSGGASSSVAAGVTPLAHGNDIAGSVRYPAYCTGIAGLRPSFGRVPAYNGTSKAERTISAQLMSVQGALARSVRDVRLGFEAMAQHDPRDPWWTPAPLEWPRRTALRAAPAGGQVPWGGPAAHSGLAADLPIRVAIVDRAEDLGGIAPSPPVAAAIVQAAQALRDAGYEVVADRTPGFARAFELWFEMMIPEFRRFMHADFERDGDDGIRVAMRFVLDNVPERGEEAHLRALAERTRLIRDWNLFLARTPLVLTPVCTELPYAHGFDLESAARTQRLWQEAATLMAVPVLGLPAMAVPTGVVDGLPVGVQIVGPRFGEDLALAAAAAIEARAPRLTPIDPL
ncbi:MAG: amidase family protein [Burkholderiales bacterium]